ncbi:HDOD domain-containing protein [Stutzerimonas azotifigens]|uniref:HDOD domain-containing protein n=1 Tax=Stutzerimonas azotifigens TaxID=291995 RepID=A0ABR5Z046_9GAMM|nr:HDOD domain-containing protein [Stutzerimonas azotifigens]MBA1273520.1 HDOD domain-containing protein [Stutzerimonas azotifigens]
MTDSAPPPRSIPGWIKVLDRVQLPALAGSHARVRHALGDSSRSLREIADLIQASPVLALSVLREANRSVNSLSEAAESLEVALSRIGLKRTEAVLARIPALEPAQIPASLRQIVVISQHASQQANGLFAARLARLWQDIHWGSLLFLSPIWTLAAAYPALFESWEHRVLAGGEPATRVEQELLGVSLLELCLAVAEHWRLPEWIVQGYHLLSGDRRRLIKALHIARDNEHPLHQQQMLDADPDLRRWLTLPSNTIVLANGLALSAHHSWSGIHSLRWQRLTGLYLQLPLATVQQLIHQQAAQSARSYPIPGTWHPAQGLLMPWDSRFQQAPAKPKPKVPDASAMDRWRTHCAQLLREPSAFSNALQLTTTARQAFTAAGMQRVLLFLADRTQSRLVTQQETLDKTAAGLTLDPTQSPLLRKLLEKPALLRLKSDNAAQYSALLPGALKERFSTENLLLRSIGTNGRVSVLVVADQNGEPFTDTALQAFEKTAQCLERALGSFSKRVR